ncbi:MAG: hypothetical protein J0M02_04710 [Planctomycetes bacterium]|nr:hypothetical protein [Planctomycetota bacterium]
MKTATLALAVLATLALAACGDERPAHSHAEVRDSHQTAASQADKSFDKEAPTDPSALK